MSFHVGLVRIELFIPQAHSLKEKRAVTRSLKDRLRGMGFSVAEVDGQDLWQRATIAVSLVSADLSWLERSVQEIRTVAERDPRAIVSGYDWDLTPAPWD